MGGIGEESRTDRRVWRGLDEEATGREEEAVLPARPRVLAGVCDESRVQRQEEDIRKDRDRGQRSRAKVQNARVGLEEEAEPRILEHRSPQASGPSSLTLRGPESSQVWSEARPVAVTQNTKFT